MAHAIEAPSAWVMQWAPLIARGPVLDLACGTGRHARWLAARGLEVVAVDREPRSIAGARFVRAELEGGRPWPFPGQRFAGIVIANYLHRPLYETLLTALAPHGVLIYETFMGGNERFGRPSNPAYLLRPGELLEAFASLQVLAFEQGCVLEPRPARVQRLCARRQSGGLESQDKFSSRVGTL